MPEIETTSNILPDERVTGAGSTALDTYTKQVLEGAIKDKVSVETDRSSYNKMKESLKDGTKIEDVNTGIEDISTTEKNASQEDSDISQSAKRNEADGSTIEMQLLEHDRRNQEKKATPTPDSG